MKKIAVLGGLLWLVCGCATTKEIEESPVADTISDTLTSIVMEPVVVAAPRVAELPPWYGIAKRDGDLLYSSIALFPDFENALLRGNAHLVFTSALPETNMIHIDAQHFQNLSVFIEGKPASYRYRDSLQIELYLPSWITPEDSIALDIAYTVDPSYHAEEKGMYFIEEPKCLWTQGEVQHNSKWFPTIDQPNEKARFDWQITIPEDMVSLMNGTCTEVRFHGDGTKTELWEMQKEHSPYLNACFVGDANLFSFANNRWIYHLRGTPDRTVERLKTSVEIVSSFERVLGVAYPWEKYAEVVLPEFTAAGMENTGAVFYYDALQKSENELWSTEFEPLLAHEIFHQWFGDLVTCNSWAHLAVNESFATYGEYLWIEEKRGIFAADAHLEKDMQQYIAEIFSKVEPIVQYEYHSPDELFDAHRYAKGGRVLHMLRTEIGDTYFFAGLQKILKEYAYQNIEISDVRRVMESVSGRDLTWFFDQWFYRKGHPELTSILRQDGDSLWLDITQQQEENYGLFRLPLTVDIYSDLGVDRKEIWLDAEKTTVGWKAPKNIFNVEIDGDHALLGMVDEAKPIEQWKYQWKKGYRFMAKLRAIDALYRAGGNHLSELAQEDILSWHPQLQERLLNYWDGILNPENLLFTVVTLAENAKSYKVRSVALRVLRDFYADNNILGIFRDAAQGIHLPLAEVSLRLLADIDLLEAQSIAKERVETPELEEVCREILERKIDPQTPLPLEE